MSQALETILRTGVVAVLRAESPEKLINVAHALSKGGVEAIEVTMTVPGALDVIKEACGEMAGVAVIGAGTVLDAQTARSAILAGAEYIVAPTVNLDVIRTAKRYGKVVCPGALTPTEILTAWEAGADIVKVFPASAVGPAYLKALKGPLPQIRLMPTGGVSVENTAAFIEAGACAVAAGGKLVDKQGIAQGNWDAITDTAREMIQEVKKGRGQV
jgi:2-dehydro-3-deoxyphosphogluconate aldolase/(4S)-4-hydroxy-2-oxoglutarate aldolase